MRMRPPILPLLALAAVLAAPLAAAHAVPVGSEPAQGARLSAPPATATVVFSEPLERSGSWIRVEDADGGRVDLDDLSFPAADTMSISVRPGLPDGVYTIHWHTFAKDTHTLDSHIGFAVGAYDPPAGGEAGYRPSAEGVAARSLVFAGIALGFGAAAWLTWLAAPPAPGQRGRALRALALGGALHTVGMALLVDATARSSGLSLPGLLASEVGKVFALRLVLGAAAAVLAGLALVARNPSRAGPAVAVVLLALAAIGSADLSHSAKGGVPGIAVDAMHLFAGATWVGALALLAGLLRTPAIPGDAFDDAAVRRLGLRFGTLALACVILLFLAGVLASVVVLGRGVLLDPLALRGSEYGRYLLAKVGVALGMVALAAVNRFVVLGQAGEGAARGMQRRLAGPGPDPTRRGLRRLVAVEAAFGAVVLVLAGALTATSPSVVASGEDGAGGATAEGDGDAFHYILRIDPAPRFGSESRLEVSVFDRETGAPVTANDCGRDSCLALSLRRAGEENATGELHQLLPDGEGHWVLDGVLFTFGGPAVAHVRVQTGGDVFLDEADLAFDVAER